MAIKRSEQVDNETGGYYHLISRCVRRAFLCGVDEETGVSFEHRRAWIEQRILKLADIFSIEVYSYAVMHNHYHLVVYFDPQGPQQWTDDEVAERWLMLFPGKLNYPDHQLQSALKLQAIRNNPKKLATYRERLGSLSWLMKCINEPIAKKSNREDCVKGHFWESRFTSQALLDESAAITCMAYVDLNPIRAGLNETLETSQHTSIQQRLKQMTESELHQAITAIAGKVRQRTMVLPLHDYIELVEWTGKQMVHPGKATIPQHLMPIFQRLNLNQDNWLNQVKAYGNHYYRAVGFLPKLLAFTEKIKQRWINGKRPIQALYSSLT